MNTTENNQNEKIDLLSITKVLWKSKRLFAMSMCLAVALGVIVAFSIPKTYKSEVILAPEMSGMSSMSNNLSDIASMVGVNINGNSSPDAIYPELYPQIISSVPFLTGLFDVKVNTSNNDLGGVTLYEYMKKHQKYPWWTRCIGFVASAFSSKDRKTVGSSRGASDFMLTKEEDDIAKSIGGSINCSVDKKTYVITISVVTQDPVVSATLAKVVMGKIQQYIINYRTKKARIDMEYARKICLEAKAQYDKAQQKYVAYSDANEDVILESFKAKRDELENEMQLRYNIYTQCAQQLQYAKAKVQERTPAFTILEPAQVPLKKDGPKRVTIVIMFMFIAFVGTSVYILFKDATGK